MDVESNASAQEFRSLAVKSTLSRWKQSERMDTLEKLIFLCVLALGKDARINLIELLVLGILGMMAYLLKEEKFEAEKTKELHRDLTYKGTSFFFTLI